MIDNNTRILVLCTGNSCRSQMAEGFLRHYLMQAGHLDAAASVRSAGLQPTRVSPNAVEVMAEMGIDLSGQTSTHLREFLQYQFDYVITVCDRAAENCPSFPGRAKRIRWSFEDPALAAGTGAEVLKRFRMVRDQIHRKIKDWLGSES